MPDNGIKFLARGGVKLDDEIEHVIEGRLARALGPPDRRQGRPHHGLPHRGRGVRRRTWSPPCRRPDLERAEGRPRLRPRRGLPGRTPQRCAPPAPRWWRSAPSPTAATSTTAAAPPTWRCSRPPCSSTAPTPASPSTATPTAAWPSTPRARSSTATRSSRCWRSALRDAGRLVDDTVVATVMSNLGFVQAMEREGITGRADQGRRPLRARGDEGARLHARGRAVRARHPQPSTPPPATAS